MGLYTPAVIIHDAAPVNIVSRPPDWLRVTTAAGVDYRRLFTSRGQLVDEIRGRANNGALDPEIMAWVRRRVLEDVSLARVSTLAGVNQAQVRRVLMALADGQQIYIQRQGGDS